VLLNLNVIATALSVITKWELLFSTQTTCQFNFNIIIPIPVSSPKAIPITMAFLYHISLYTAKSVFDRVLPESRTNRQPDHVRQLKDKNGEEWKGRIGGEGAEVTGVRFDDCIHHLGKIDDPATMGDLL